MNHHQKVKRNVEEDTLISYFQDKDIIFSLGTYKGELRNIEDMLQEGLGLI